MLDFDEFPFAFLTMIVSLEAIFLSTTIVAPNVSRALTQRFVGVMANHRPWTREPALHLPL